MIDIPFELLGVYDRGIPNKERVVIKADDYAELSRFFVGVGIRQPAYSVNPINDNSLWMGSGFVSPGDWIFVYTGTGLPRADKIPNQKNTIYTLHWGRSGVLFQSPEIVPFIYRLDGVRLPNEMNEQIPHSEEDRSTY